MKRLWLGGICLLLLAGAWSLRGPILRGTANLWIVDQPVTKADAIVVLGGRLQNRPFAAAALYHQGMAPKVLFMNVEREPTAELGITAPEGDLTHKVLLAQGVPEADLVAIGNNVSSSYEEACAVRGWAKQTGAKHLIIPTDLFHTRRIRWLYEKELRGTGIEATVTAVPPRRYTAANWWQRESGLIDFQNEVVKSAYYHLKY